MCTEESSAKPKPNADIPEWLLSELLVRLPVNCVFRSKLVSKQWLSLISDPSFVRMYLSRASISPHSQPWTFITDYMRVEDTNSDRLNDHGSLMDSHSSTGSKHPGILVIPCPSTDHHQDGTRYNVIGVSNGLVLYGVHEDELYLHECYRYKICNPITGQWIAVPLKARDFKNVSTGFLTRVENNVLTSYVVVRLEIPSQGSETIRLDVFASETGEWEEITVFLDQAIEVTRWRRPTALNGVLHWMTYRHGIVAYDPCFKRDRLRFIALPGDIDVKCNDESYKGVPSLLDVHQGSLRYFESSRHQRLGFSGFGVWLLKDYSSGEWCIQHRVGSEDILNLDILSRPYFPIPISFHPFDSDIVYLGSDNLFCSYNIRTRKLEDHSGSIDIEDIVGPTKVSGDKIWPRWWFTFLLMIPPWPICIPSHAPLVES